MSNEQQREFGDDYLVTEVKSAEREEDFAFKITNLVDKEIVIFECGKVVLSDGLWDKDESQVIINKIPTLVALSANRGAPQLYDIRKDEMRPVTQNDVDLLTKAAEEAGLRNALIRRLLGWDRDKLRLVRKLFDDNFNQPGKTNGQG